MATRPAAINPDESGGTERLLLGTHGLGEVGQWLPTRLTSSSRLRTPSFLAVQVGAKRYELASGDSITIPTGGCTRSRADRQP